MRFTKKRLNSSIREGAVITAAEYTIYTATAEIPLPFCL